ncbi:antibiotic biosynthesis monooxygenase [Pseudenhygromyxa sp. WMMC2535]|uniref:antibiotic biosynthesis monooxygenase family protein n=1 Tax=Pseudenhygromyxa sp. WMMC2535 TaxID=2712867 RepID=UPI00155512B3|nr:antibiotic biosynthesis monooxygenase family protein [Pseudenhygromyxa sp. WMMC2535]NVB37212.1 antibiotic biosynthesis monooxygenase [Pseudenhygromyxa sp. WMMC2535]
MTNAAASIDAQAERLTLINVYEVEPARQAELARALSELTEAGIRQQPGFVSVCVHSSVDGKRVINYAQWASQADFEAFMRRPETRAQLETFAAIASSVTPSIYRVDAVHLR